MNKTAVNRVLDFLLWISFCLMAATGALLAFRLPPGSRGGGGLSVWGWTRHDWGDLHTWNSYVFLGLILLHLILHARWLWSVAGGRVKSLFLAGLIGGAAMVGAVWMLPVEKGSGHGNGSERHEKVEVSASGDREESGLSGLKRQRHGARVRGDERIPEGDDL